jgi:hypothetical protein
VLLFTRIRLILPVLMTYTLGRQECNRRAARGLGFASAGGISAQLAMSRKRFRYQRVLPLILGNGGDVPMRVVDADAHVIEGPAAFEFLAPAFRAARPVPLVFDEGWAGGMYAHFNALWLIEGKVFPKLAGRGWHIFGTPPLSNLCRQRQSGQFHGPGYTASPSVLQAPGSRWA